MQCFPIYSMLLAVGNPVVDYMSLDIEGTEYDVSLYELVKILGTYVHIHFLKAFYKDYFFRF